jgi:hypothetical protein
MKFPVTVLVLGLVGLARPLSAQAPASTASTAAPAPIASEAPRVYLEEAKVVVDGKAEYNGSVEFEFTPLNGTPKSFDVTVLAKAGRKDVAKDIHKELTIAAGESYKVKLSGDEVRISKKSSKVPNFAIVIRKLNVAGVSVLVKRG